MARIQKHNLQHIKQIFEENTGTDLNAVHRANPRRFIGRTLAFTAALLFALTMLAFSRRLFTPLDGDALSLGAAYEGGGIVTVYVENGSEKDLKFQEQLKLINWFTEEEAPRLGGKVRFSQTLFRAGTSGTMTIDLSQAYDIAYLEKNVQNPWYYLLLTNQDFLFGHDWMCSVYFAEEREAEEAPPTEAPAPAAEGLGDVEEELRFYFEKAYGGLPLSFNEANFLYQQRVEELLRRFDGNVVPSLSPEIMVGGPSVFLDPEPVLKDIPGDVVFDQTIPADRQYLLTRNDWTYLDGYGRMVASQTEKALVQYAMLPQRPGDTDGGVSMPLVFLMIYDAQAAAVPENCAFVYGRFLSFAEMAQYRVYCDEHYAIYDITGMIYTDVGAYLDYFRTTREDIYCDEQVRKRVYSIYTYFRDKEHLAELIGYRVQ